MLAYMVPYEGVQIKFKLYFPLGSGAEHFAATDYNDIIDVEACGLPKRSNRIAGDKRRRGGYFRGP